MASRIYGMEIPTLSSFMFKIIIIVNYGEQLVVHQFRISSILYVYIYLQMIVSLQK
jgi:hypothetical protein